MTNAKLFLTIGLISLLYTGCNEEEKQAVQTKPVVAEEQSTVDKVSNSVITHVESAAQTTEQLAKDIQTSTAPAVKEVAKSIKEAQENVSEKTEKITAKIKEASAPIIKSVKEAVTTPDADLLYKKCATCHGLNAEKKALNRSAVIKDWDASQIKTALLGYQAGTYGGAMKGLMQGQVKDLKADEVTALAEHIADFK